MYRDMSDGITNMDEMIGTIGAFNKGGGYANVNNGIKRIEGGGKRPILDPITSLSQMAVSMISKCERNDVAKTFVKLGQDFSGLGDIVVRDPTLKHADPTAFAFTVWQNGEQVVYRTTPEIYDALTNNDAQANRFTIKIASGIAQTLRTGATISPSFIVRNLLRDTMSATVNSKTGFYLPFVDNVRGAWKLHFDKEFSAEYHASGASMSTYMRADADSSRDLTKELLGHKYDSYPVVVKQVRQLISYAWHKYEKFGSAGRFVANMLNDPISYVRGNSRPSEPAKYWYEMPVIGSFIRQNGQNSEYINRMYEIKEDMNDDYKRSDAYQQRKGKKSSSNKPKELKQVDTAVKSVSKLNKEIQSIRNDPKKDPDQKRREIDQRRTKINDLAKKVVVKFDK